MKKSYKFSIASAAVIFVLWGSVFAYDSIKLREPVDLGQKSDHIQAILRNPLRRIALYTLRSDDIFFYPQRLCLVEFSDEKDEFSFVSVDAASKAGFGHAYDLKSWERVGDEIHLKGKLLNSNDDVMFLVGFIDNQPRRFVVNLE